MKTLRKILKWFGIVLGSLVGLLVLAAWSEQDFITTMRTGVTPLGQSLNIEMPWKNFGQMTDDELKALWMYLQSLPDLKQGG